MTLDDAWRDLIDPTAVPAEDERLRYTEYVKALDTPEKSPALLHCLAADPDQIMAGDVLRVIIERADPDARASLMQYASAGNREFLEHCLGDLALIDTVRAGMALTPDMLRRVESGSLWLQITVVELTDDGAALKVLATSGRSPQIRYAARTKIDSSAA